MYIQTNINIGMKLHLLHNNKNQNIQLVEEAFDFVKFSSLHAFKDHVIEKYFTLECTPHIQTEEQTDQSKPLTVDQKNNMILIVKVQKDWLKNSSEQAKNLNKFKRIDSDEEWNKVIQSVLLAHTKEQSSGESGAIPKAIVVEFKVKCKPAKRMIKQQLKELRNQKKHVKNQFVMLKEEKPITQPSVASVDNIYPTLSVPVETFESVNIPTTNADSEESASQEEKPAVVHPLKVKRELLLEKKLKLQEMRAQIKMMKAQTANSGEENREKMEKKLAKEQEKLQRKKEKLEMKEKSKTERLLKNQEKRELKLKEKEEKKLLRVGQSKDDVQLIGESGQAMVLKPEIKRIFIDGNNMFFMNRAMRHILLELKNRKLAEDVITTTSKLYSQVSELLWDQPLHLMQVCFDSSSQQDQVISNPNVTFVVTSAKQEGYSTADDFLVELANRQNIACLLDSCLFVTSDRVLRQRLKQVGAKCASSGNWMNFIYSHLCSNTNEISLDDWLLQILDSLNHH